MQDLKDRPIDTDKSLGLDAINRATELPDHGKKPGNLFTTAMSYVLIGAIFIFATECILNLAGLGEEEIFKLDPDLGTRHMTNKKVTWRKEGYACSYLNHLGMREKDATQPKAKGVYRIALLGDSQVESIQVRLEQSFGQILQKKLSQSLGRPVEILNFGVSGYSTVQEYLLMKTEVMRWAPDMVIVGYDGRDIFENWATPDQMLSNVRPMALKLPGQALVIDKTSVTSWRKSMRGRYMCQAEWLRQNSRIWGLVCQAETELGFHNPVYKWIVNYFTDPGKSARQLQKDLSSGLLLAECQKAVSKQLSDLIKIDQSSSFNVQYYIDDKKPQEKLGGLPGSSKDPLAAGQKLQNKTKPVPVVTQSSRVFLKLLSETLEALFADMQQIAKAHDAKLVIVGLPSRATLAALPSMSGFEQGLDHKGELTLVENQAKKLGLPYIDAQAAAEKYSEKDQLALFYSAHLTPKGQQYLADQLYLPIKDLILQDQSK